MPHDPEAPNAPRLSHIKVDPLDAQLDASIHGDHEEAWRLAQILERERPNDNRAAFNRGWHYMRRGDLLKGFELTERGRLEGVYGSKVLATTKPLWSGVEDLRGKTILLRGEGGFGDEIINIRFAKNLAERGARVVASVSSGLVGLLNRTPGASEVISHDQVPVTPFDYWVPAMSAALYLGVDYQKLSGTPYISPNAEAVAIWSHIIKSSKCKVGIRWSGNPKFEHEQHRRFPPELLFELRHIPGIELYSLQRDNDLRDLPPGIVDLQFLLNSWEDTAAAIANLDLVITSCTAVAHLAAAMGKETWVILPILPYYVWALPGESSPWYDTVRLFRQEVYGTWDAPLRQVREALEERVHPNQQSTQPSSEFFTQSSTPTFTPTTFSARVPPGVYTAPSPLARTTMHTASNKSTLHFMAGLPRSGSTALLSLLAQNPRMYTAPVSGLCGILGGIYANWDKGEFHQEQPNPEAKRRVLRAVLDHYHATECPIVLDKDRQWISILTLLEELLERPVKVVVPVRPIPEILASFEVLRQRQPLEFTGADEALGPMSTIETRAAHFAADTGAIGVAYNAMKDAVTSGHLDRMLFVDYNKLMSAPNMQLARIYDFLGEPNFEHDLAKIVQTHSNDSRAHKFVGLHDVRPEFKKTSRPPREVLGDVYGKYDQPEPWSMWT